MEQNVRVVEGGGSGLRRVDVRDRDIGPATYPTGEVKTQAEIVRFAGEDLPGDTQAIIYSLAGVMENHSRIVVSPHMGYLNGMDLGQATREATRRPSFVACDMETSVWGMSVIYPQLAYFIGMAWSSGIGIRIYQERIGILSDSEAGHMRVNREINAPVCDCGLSGCVDSLCGGVGVAKMIKRILKAMDRNNIPDSASALWKILDKEYLEGQSWAQDVYRSIAENMGIFLADLQITLRVPAVVFKGTLAQKALRLPRIEEWIRESMRENLMMPAWEKEMKFYLVPGPPEMPQDADAFLGAAILAEKLVHSSKSE